MPLVILVFIIAVIVILIRGCGEIITESALIISPLFDFLIDHIYLIFAILILFLALFSWEYLRENPFEKIYKDYKKGRIRRQEAIVKISKAVYDYKKDPIPSAYKSEIMARRIKSLTKRIKAEKEFIDEITEYIKARARLGKD